MDTGNNYTGSNYTSESGATVRDVLRDSTIARLLVKSKAAAIPAGDVSPISRSTPKAAETEPPLDLSFRTGNKSPMTETVQRKRKADSPLGVLDDKRKCLYCPFVTRDISIMSNHYQYHRQMFPGAATTSHLEWMKTYPKDKQARDKLPVATYITSSSHSPGGTTIDNSTSTLRTLLQPTEKQAPVTQTASGFLKSIVHNIMRHENNASPAYGSRGSSRAVSPSGGSIASSRMASPNPANISTDMPIDNVRLMSSVMSSPGQNRVPQLTFVQQVGQSYHTYTNDHEPKQQSTNSDSDQRKEDWLKQEHGDKLDTGMTRSPNEVPHPDAGYQLKKDKYEKDSYEPSKDKYYYTEPKMSRVENRYYADETSSIITSSARETDERHPKVELKFEESCSDESRSPAAPKQWRHATTIEANTQCDLNSSKSDCYLADSATSASSLCRCQHCGITFDDEVIFSIHMGCHNHKDPFICNVCGKSCGNKYGFYTHIMRGHEYT